MTSLNDGRLDLAAPDATVLPTIFTYPNPGWTNGVVGRGPDGRPDPARRVLTFVTPPLETDTQVVGPIELILYASSTNNDTDFFVKLSDQLPGTADEQKAGLNPRSSIVTKGWLRASHRALDPKWSLPHAPWYSDAALQLLHPGQVYKLDIAVMPTAHLFKKGSRIRLELANGDSAATDAPFTHRYGPRKLGSDTIYHDAAHPSELSLPLLPGEHHAMINRTLTALTALTALLLGGAPARSADVIPTHRLSAQLATDIALASIAACEKMTYRITAVVLDYDGIPIALIRGDGAGIHTVQAAQDKAFTSVTYGRDGSETAKLFKNDPTNGVILKEPRLLPGDGGMPIKIGTEVVGALGISGSPGKDEVCGNAALDTVRARLK